MASCRRFIILGLLFMAAPAYAESTRNLGRMGTVYSIVEPDMVEEIKARVDQEKLARFMAEQKQSYQPKDIRALPTARRDRTFFVDMTFTLDHDIHGENGEIMYQRGLTWNPLDYVSPPQIVVINGEDARQVEWFEKSPYYNNLKIKLLLSAGYAAPLIKHFNRPVFYLTRSIAERLQLAAAPSVILQNGKKIMVQEVKVDE